MNVKIIEPTQKPTIFSSSQVSTGTIGKIHAPGQSHHAALVIVCGISMNRVIQEIGGLGRSWSYSALEIEFFCDGTHIDIKI